MPLVLPSVCTGLSFTNRLSTLLVPSHRGRTLSTGECATVDPTSPLGPSQTRLCSPSFPYSFPCSPGCPFPACPPSPHQSSPSWPCILLLSSSRLSLILREVRLRHPLWCLFSGKVINNRKPKPASGAAAGAPSTPRTHRSGSVVLVNGIKRGGVVHAADFLRWMLFLLAPLPLVIIQAHVVPCWVTQASGNAVAIVTNPDKPRPYAHTQW